MKRSEQEDSEADRLADLSALSLGVDSPAYRRERDRARELRKTGWWRRKIATGVCYYCGRQVSPNQLSMDHVIPLARGGRSTRENLVAACRDCNIQKKNLLPAEWQAYLDRLSAPAYMGEGTEPLSGIRLADPSSNTTSTQ